MRLVSLDLSGFRGFAGRRQIDLDADAIVVVGANGNGKTSLFDSVLWAFTGRIPRLGNDDSRVLSMYAESGEARVELKLRQTSGTMVTVLRSSDGVKGRLAVEIGSEKFQGPTAQGKLIELLWPDAASASEPEDALASVLTKCVYLQQDLLRQFIDAESDHERFAAVSELVGAGRLTELQASLEKSKKAWTTTTNQRAEELRVLRERLAILDARLADLNARVSAAKEPVLLDAWTAWWQSVARFHADSRMVDIASREASLALDSAIKGMDAIRRNTERRLQDLRELATETSRLAQASVPDIEALRKRVEEARGQVDALKGQVSDEQARLTELRKIQAELRDKTEQLRALASLALRQLDEHCPVCAQTYDKEFTRKRLEAIVKQGESSVAVEPTSEALEAILKSLAAAEKQFGDADIAVRSAQQEQNRLTAARDAVRKRLRELGVEGEPGEDLQNRIEAAARKAVDDAAQLAELQRNGESIALRLGQGAATRAREELQKEAGGLRQDISEREKAISARNRTGDRAQQVIEALREASTGVVARRIADVTPLLQSIYTRVDPHPAFRAIRFLSQLVRGKGQLSTVVSDPIASKECDQPASVLSSSQVNALAVTVFLSLSLGMPEAPLNLAMLDDPIQSLDDINLLGLVDLLRRAKDGRQLMVSTHDARFGSLLARKLRPIQEPGRTVVIDLDGWSRRGPHVEVREVRADPVPLRLVSKTA